LYRFVHRLAVLAVLAVLAAFRINNLRVINESFGFDFHTPPPEIAGFYAAISMLVASSARHHRGGRLRNPAFGDRDCRESPSW
jgi:hypothetical protein